MPRHFTEEIGNKHVAARMAGYPSMMPRHFTEEIREATMIDYHINGTFNDASAFHRGNRVGQPGVARHAQGTFNDASAFHRGNRRRIGTCPRQGKALQ